MKKLIKKILEWVLTIGLILLIGIAVFDYFYIPIHIRPIIYFVGAELLLVGYVIVDKGEFLK